MYTLCTGLWLTFLYGGAVCRNKTRRPQSSAIGAVWVWPRVPEVGGPRKQQSPLAGSHNSLVAIYALFGCTIFSHPCDEYSNIFKYFRIQIFVHIIFVSCFWYKYIRIFVRNFLLQIYSDIHSYNFFDTNIFRYSFLSFLIKIYSREKISQERQKVQKLNGSNCSHKD